MSFCLEKIIVQAKVPFWLCVYLNSLKLEQIKYLCSEKLWKHSGCFKKCGNFNLMVHFLMLSIKLLGHNVGRLYAWVFHATKVLLVEGARLAGSVVFLSSGQYDKKQHNICDKIIIQKSSFVSFKQHCSNKQLPLHISDLLSGTHCTERKTWSFHEKTGGVKTIQAIHLEWRVTTHSLRNTGL